MEAVSQNEAPRYLIRDRDAVYGATVVRRLRAMGIRDRPTAPASPWQNGYAERLIGSIRRESLDHIVIWGEAHLRRILRTYAQYYNDVRTHRSLDKDAPVSRPVQRTGSMISRPVLGGLHHHYVESRFSVHTTGGIGQLVTLQNIGIHSIATTEACTLKRTRILLNLGWDTNCRHLRFKMNRQ